MDNDAIVCERVGRGKYRLEKSLIAEERGQTAFELNQEDKKKEIRLREIS